ncbi:glycosyltransferase family 4 protein [Pseudomonas frederiksbergensis]|uniref:glycosyltransferase family 4 protein n=1 Tax=Pseudomonas frederiksbergensis TaxID=104087 RepID=UPI000F488B91|nr:glycosyltransferase family 4 protein [Pseudomonas frederiksbergensis]
MESIHFVWSDYPLLPGAGGSEAYTIGQVRELKRRGIECDILSIGLGRNDGRRFFPDIKFRQVEECNIEKIDGVCIFVTKAFDVKTKTQSYVMLHCPPPRREWGQETFFEKIMKDKKLITTSQFSAEAWSKYLRVQPSQVAVVYPFADEAFGIVERTKNIQPTIVFAGRLNPEKGVYALLCAMHSSLLDGYQFLFVRSGEHTPDGKLIMKLLRAHPRIKLIKSRRTPTEMAELLACCDVLVFPTAPALCVETFGMLSIEAQHAGCKVVASNTGGLAETNLGGVCLVEPDNPISLAEGIVWAVESGGLRFIDREKMKQHFTVKSSVDTLLEVIAFYEC